MVLYHGKKKKKKNSKKRIIRSPKIGGFVPILPLITGIASIGSAIGSLINTYRSSKQANRNKAMEAIGKGLYLKPYKYGEGLKRKKKKLH